MIWIVLHTAFAAVGTSAQPAPTPPLLFPAPGARDICPDTPLRITFSDAPQVGRGKIQVFDATDDALVEAIDVAAPTRTRTIGGLPNFSDHPVIISDSQVSVYLSSQALGYHKTYYVKVDAGAFMDGAGNAAALGLDDNSWRFTTRSAPPAQGSRRLTVAADGSGDFATVQGAIDFVPEGNTVATQIFIRRGTYNEIVAFTRKHAITLLGEDRKQTVIAYANNERFNGNAGGNPFAPGAGAPGAANPRRGGAVYRRGLFLAHRADDLVIANLTLRNTTPQGGSQAEAIILNGSPSARAMITSVDLYSFQDTLQINGQAYISDCSIEGDVDFMWGTGPCFFENCTARSLRSRAYYTQIRNPASNHGYVYKSCTFNGAPGVTDNFLSRIAPARFPASEMVLIDCVLTGAVGAVAWRLDQAKEAPNVHFWEYRSHDAEGKPADTSGRLAAGRQLTLPNDAETIAGYSDPKFVLGNQWSPELAPIITSQPEEATIRAGEAVMLAVNAVAVPRATYQWQKDGADLTGATSATYTIEHSGPNHVGSYAVVVRNSAGKVTSQPARLRLSGHEPGR
jgi:pectin methylesterase-like acyl-CoA thioesterase